MQLWLQVCADLGGPVSKAKTFLAASAPNVFDDNSNVGFVGGSSSKVVAIKGIDGVAAVRYRGAVAHVALDAAASAGAAAGWFTLIHPVLLSPGWWIFFS